MIDHANSKIPIHRQCDLVGLLRGAYYYEPKGED